MELASRQAAQGRAASERPRGGSGHPLIARFDKVRELLVRTGLPPEPDIYDLFWRYAAGDDFQLRKAVDAALAAGPLDRAAVAALRRALCGDLDPSGIAAMVEAARLQADWLSRRLRDGQADLATYGRAIADGDAALNRTDASATRDELAALIAPLGAATADMMAANSRLEGELAAAVVEAAGLRDRLAAAERAAVTDALTGLLNRRGLMEALEAAQATARRESAPLTVALVDIDHFKRVNDTWGHALGDEVLKFVGNHLKGGVGADSVVGRLGGEEFVAVLPGRPIAEAVSSIDSLRSALAGQVIRRTDDGASMGRITFSAGIAGDKVTDSAESIIARADAALYAAKRGGRDRVVHDRS